MIRGVLYVAVVLSLSICAVQHCEDFTSSQAADVSWVADSYKQPPTAIYNNVNPTLSAILKTRASRAAFGEKLGRYNGKNQNTGSLAILELRPDREEHMRVVEVVDLSLYPLSSQKKNFIS